MRGSVHARCSNEVNDVMDAAAVVGALLLLALVVAEDIGIANGFAPEEGTNGGDAEDSTDDEATPVVVAALFFAMRLFAGTPGGKTAALLPNWLVDHGCGATDAGVVRGAEA